MSKLSYTHTLLIYKKLSAFALFMLSGAKLWLVVELVSGQVRKHRQRCVSVVSVIQVVVMHITDPEIFFGVRIWFDIKFKS